MDTATQPCLVPGTHTYTGCKGYACQFFDPRQTIAGCWAYTGHARSHKPERPSPYTTALAATPGEQLQEEDESEPL